MTTPSHQPDELDDTLHMSDVRDNNRTAMRRVSHYRHREIKGLLNRFRSQNICGHSKSSDVFRLHHHQQHRAVLQSMGVQPGTPILQTVALESADLFGTPVTSPWTPEAD